MTPPSTRLDRGPTHDGDRNHCGRDRPDQGARRLFNLTMILSEIHDHGWSIGRKLIPLASQAIAVARAAGKAFDPDGGIHDIQ